MSSRDLPWRPERTALLIIDMQRYFTVPGSVFARLSALRLPDKAGAAYFERIDTLVVPNILRLQGGFREHGSPVFYTRLGSNSPEGTDLPGWARRLDAAGRKAFGSPVFPQFPDPSAQLDGRLELAGDEFVLCKTTTGALASCSLEHDLRTRGIRSVAVTGVLTALCVSQTARELADRDFDVAIVQDACASLTEAAHEAALSAFAAVYGWVISSSEWLAEIRNGGNP